MGSMTSRFLAALVLPVLAVAQNVTSPPSGDNQRTTVTQHVGLVTISVDYSSPRVHLAGKDRRGHIWGELVPWGMADLRFNNGKLSPWRAGANQNTVFTVSHDVMVEDHPLPAGSYGIHMIPQKDEWTVIFSKESTAWGSFFYDPEKDFLRIAAKPVPHDYREWLTYDFPVREPDHARVEMQWEDLAVGWDIKVPNMNDLYLTKIRQELHNASGFDRRGFESAAQFTLQANTDLDEGLSWISAATKAPLAGDVGFSTLSTRYQLLDRLNRTGEAKQAMEELASMPGVTPQQIHTLARQMQIAKKNEAAVAIYKLNAKRFGDAWPTNVGMGRAAALEGDDKMALEYFRKAAAQAPDDLNRRNLQGFVKTLEDGKPIAQ